MNTGVQNINERRDGEIGCLSRLVRWWKRLDPNYRDREDRAARLQKRIKAEAEESQRPCPYCGASVKKFVVTLRSHRGRMADADKEWACGTKTSLRFMRESSFERGEDCLSNTKSTNAEGNGK